MIPQDKIRRFFVVAVVLAAAVRGYLFWQYYCISSDGVVYIKAAENFYAKSVAAGLASVYPPGYPLLVAAIYPLVGNWEWAGQILSLFFGVGLLFPLFWIFREVFDAPTAVVACYLAAMSPFLALYSVHVRTESTYLFFASLVLFLVLSAIQKGLVGRMVLAGLVGGYAYLVRPEAIGFLFLVPLFLIIHWLLKRDTPVGCVLKFTAALCAGFLACALPYIVYLSIDTGRIGTISRKAGVTLGINLEESGYLAADDLKDGGIDFVDYVQKHPFRYLTKVVSDLPAATRVFFEAVHYSYVPFLLLGLVLIGRDRLRERKDLLLIGFVLLYVYGFALFYVKRRYALQAVPISLGWVALGLCWLWRILQNSLSRIKALGVGLAIGLALIIGTLPKTLKPVSREKAYVRDAGLYLKGRGTTRRLKVAVFDDRVTFYAHAQTIFLDPRDPSSLLPILYKQGADYLAAEAKVLDRVYPGVSTRPGNFGLALEQRFVGTRRDQMLIFKVL